MYCLKGHSFTHDHVELTPAKLFGQFDPQTEIFDNQNLIIFKIIL